MAAQQDIDCTTTRVGDADVHVYPANLDTDDASDRYVVEVFGVSLLIRRRNQDGGSVDTYVHVDGKSAERDTWLRVEVMNGGESWHPIGNPAAPDPHEEFIAELQRVLAEDFPGRTAVKVVFGTDEWDNGYFYDENGGVTFADGGTERDVDFGDTVRDVLNGGYMHGSLGRWYEVTVDLVAGIVDCTC